MLKATKMVQSDFYFLRRKYRKTCLFFSWHSSNSPLSWSVIQQKNGSIKSWSSSCQVTPHKWVLKLFFPLFFGGGSQTHPVFKVRKWKLCFLMSCLSGCLCVWWSVKCSVTLTKWPWLCCCGFKWASPQWPYLCLHPAWYKWEGRNGGHP